MSSSRLSARWAPYLFVAPFLLGFAVFMIYPLIQSVILATQYTYGPKSSQFTGLANFAYMMGDPLFWKAVKNTTVFALGSVFIQLPLSLGLAVLLNNPKVKARSFFRMILFAPSLVGIVFVAIVFSLVFEKNTGLLNKALTALTLDMHSVIPAVPVFSLEYAWLQEHIMLAMIIAALWMYVGFNMVYFLAALQNVSRDHVEAAEVDGANGWQVFWNVTVPAIKPVAAFVVLLSIIGSFQLFELPFVLLGGGGTQNRGLTVVMYLYQNGFDSGDLGYASAIGWMLALLLGTIAFMQRKFTRSEDI